MIGQSPPAASAWLSAGLEVLRSTDFSNGHLNRLGTYAVCFGAAWCPVTRRFMPRFVALKGRTPATFAIADITDLKDPLWDDFAIRITPSIILFRDGNVYRRIDGHRFIGITRSTLEGLVQSVPPT
jgi:hypothetical protein